MDETFEGRFAQAQLLWGNIAARPLRAFLSILAITIQVFLVLMIVGLTTGVISEWGKRVEGVGADILVQPPNSSMFLACSRAVLPESLADKVAKLPGVDEVAPTLTLMDQKNFVLVYGIDYRRFNALSRGFLFRSGRPFEAANEAIADDIVAQAKHLKVGDSITLLNHSFTICGIVAHGKGARYFIPLKTAKDMPGADQRVSMLYVRSKGDVEATREQILNVAPGDGVKSMAEYTTLMNSSKLPELKPFIRTMVGLGMVISFLVVLLNMHTMVLERTREIGILKALGSSRLDIVRLLLAYAISTRKGLILLTGEVGTGKTMLIRRLLDWLTEQKMPTALIFNSHIQPEHLLDFILNDFGVPCASKLKSAKLMALNHWLLEGYRADQTPSLIVDWAQGLDPSALDAILLLLNFETPREKLLQIVLAGQPELQEKLKRHELRQLRQRITVRCTTAPLTLEQTYGYIGERLRIAGASDQPIFEPDAVGAIHAYSRGIPRVINVLAEHSLINACAEDANTVSARAVAQAATDCQLDRADSVARILSTGSYSTASVSDIGALLASISASSDAPFGPVHKRQFNEAPSAAPDAVFRSARPSATADQVSNAVIASNQLEVNATENNPEQNFNLPPLAAAEASEIL